jgi:flagellar protein FlaG
MQTEPAMRIEQATMGNHIHQIGTAVSAPEAVSHVTEVSNPLQSANRVMEFTIDPESGKHVVKIMDSTSHELIRRIPMEEALALARSLDQLKGLLL